VIELEHRIEALEGKLAGVVKTQVVSDLLGGDLRRLVATSGGRLVGLLPSRQPVQRADEPFCVV
jgi:hypothetical protein